MQAEIIREYRKFRANGMRAKFAIASAKTVVEWRELESFDLVKLEAVPDSDPYDFGDCLDGLSERSAEEYKERIYNLGIYGSVGSYRCSCCGEFVVADSVWGHAGYNDVLSPYENGYITDVMANTIEAYKASKGGD